MRTLFGSALEAELHARASSLASALAARRQFVSLRTPAAPEDGFFASASRSEASFDPRLLTFEFMSTFLLRGQQVALISDFMAGVRDCKSTAPDRRSSCHQMIMGGGKTTVTTLRQPWALCDPHAHHPGVLCDPM